MSEYTRSTTEHDSYYRISSTLNDELMNGQRSQVPPPPGGVPQVLPEPVFPQKPKLYAAPDDTYFPKNGKRHWTAPQIYRSMRGWMFPYFRSRLQRGEFHPIIAYLFNEWKCNLDCNYCWAYDNRVSGMTEDVAKRSIDWLHSTTCRAGQNSIIIRTDGTLAPCFPMYSTNHDWGTIEAPRMEPDQLVTMKRTCESNCFSTLNHILAFCYNDTRVIRWLFKQSLHGFQGVRGNME